MISHQICHRRLEPRSCLVKWPRCQSRLDSGRNREITAPLMKSWRLVYSRNSRDADVIVRWTSPLQIPLTSLELVPSSCRMVSDTRVLFRLLVYPWGCSPYETARLVSKSRHGTTGDSSGEISCYGNPSPRPRGTVVALSCLCL